ncbi:hypothetical protein CLV63_11666 [Murinocardiopsis flavida]|uniref:Uncharacterized protein n=1 Tax=Murinocardiopsis flavida TaxID=645275 RepID=A0A2P8D8X5_9ACTN|nr:type II toxin-antitoxin system HicB family antitoxin [Murinocardiopsis flavida]PSK93659.1 hypothetical protein CLV63_11666 [Murinocardiopsis flavida]
MRLTATVIADGEVGGYVARAVEVEVTSQGETPEKALGALSEPLELYFEGDEDLVPAEHVTLVAPVDVRLSA